MPATYLIRPARPGDVARLAEVEQAANTLFAGSRYDLPALEGNPSTSGESLYEALALGRLWVAVAEDAEDSGAAEAGGDDIAGGSGVPVGFALAWVVDGVGHLEEIDVEPAHGRQGLGSALVETVCAWARAQGFPALTLTTFADVPWNAPFYRRLGFRVLAPEDLTPDLGAILAEEDRRMPGLPRVAMRRDLG